MLRLRSLVLLSIFALGQPIVGAQSAHSAWDPIGCIQRLVHRSASAGLPVESNFVPRREKPIYHDQLFSVKEKYIGENDGINLPRRSDTKVKYLQTPEEREPYRVHIVNGKLYSSNGKLLDSNNRKLIFVLDRFGNIYTEREDVSNFYHSSFLAGDSVAFAGEFFVSKGRITQISNRSGHYKPPMDSIIRIIQFFKKNGVMIDIKDIIPIQN